MVPEKRAARGAATARARGNEPAPAVVKTVEAAEAESREGNLDDPLCQHEIVHPPTTKAVIGGQAYELHPLSARRKMALTGLIHSVVGSAFQDGARMVGAILDIRLSSIIAEQYLERLIPFAAAATQPPGKLDEQQIAMLSAEFAQSISYAEISLLVAILTEQNNVWKSIHEWVAAKKG